MFKQLTNQQLQKIKGGSNFQPRSFADRNDSFFIKWQYWFHR